MSEASALNYAPPRRLSRIAWAYIAAIALLAITLLAGLGFGPLKMSPAEIWGALTGNPAEPRHSALLWQLRLPRNLMAGLVGAGLAASGALMQGLFRNPMADPGLLGVSSGSSLAAAGVIVLGGSLLPPGWQPLGLTLGAFFGGLIATFIVQRIAVVEGRTPIAGLLLAGIAITALGMAGTGFFSFLSDDRQMRDINFWLLGSVGGASWHKALVLAPFALLPLALAPRFARGLDALNLGEREAGHLGVDVEAMKLGICVVVAFAVGACVSASGAISFVGLLVPHAVRLAVGPAHRHLLPLSGLVGASLMILADLVARIVVAPADLPVGIITAFLGAPCFLFLLRRARRELAI